MITIESIRSKLTYGIPPLTHEECCWLFTHATGEYIEPPSKRCPKCDGEGTQVVSTGPWTYTRECSYCSGSGKAQVV